MKIYAASHLDEEAYLTLHCLVVARQEGETPMTIEQYKREYLLLEDVHNVKCADYATRSEDGWKGFFRQMVRYTLR